MYSMMDIHEFKSLDETGTSYYESFVDSSSDTQAITESLSISKDLDIPISESVDSIYGKPDVSINLPSGVLELSFEPHLNDTKGALTSDIDDEIETVRSDPFDISPIIDPNDPQAELNQELEAEESDEDDTPRYMTIQDLM